jgi:molybdopterin molybdotransferase
MLPVDKALEIVLAHAQPLGREDVLLPEALGRVLAEDVHADVDLPPFERAAMDGYAVRAGDATHAPVVLDVVGQVRAGRMAGLVLERGQAVQIMTGAPVPVGATAVLQVEKTRAVDGGRRVELLEPVAPGANVASAGSEARAGDLVVRRGCTIDPATIAALASVGRGRVSVGRRPRVGVLVTGDELVDVWDKPTLGRIRNSNGYAVEAQVRWTGSSVVPLGVVPDREDAIAAAVHEGFSSADVLVVSGGVSAGVYDLVEPVLSRFDVQVLFDKVAIKPGAPLVFGRRGDTLVFGLPGNPVSAQVTFDLFVRAALLRMQGAGVVQRPTVPVHLSSATRNRSGRRFYAPARVAFGSTGLVAEPLRSSGSADVFAHARANALVVLEADRPSYAAGEQVSALLLGNFLERDVA